MYATSAYTISTVDGLETLKLVLVPLALPPVPGMLLMLLGAAIARRRAAIGPMLLVLGALLVWLGSCQGFGIWLQRELLPPTPPLAAIDIAKLKATRGGARPTSAIVVLGAGRSLRAPETGSADLTPRSLERLRYGVWLARETGLPIAISGGTGWAQRPAAGLSEAEIAQRVAERDFRYAVTWTETESRDTRENALNSVRLLREQGIRHIVLVTHAWHMPRALRQFKLAGGETVRITAAPMGYLPSSDRGWLDWLPSINGHTHVSLVLREVLARTAGE